MVQAVFVPVVIAVIQRDLLVEAMKVEVEDLWWRWRIYGGGNGSRVRGSFGGGR